MLSGWVVPEGWSGVRGGGKNLATCNLYGCVLPHRAWQFWHCNYSFWSRIWFYICKETSRAYINKHVDLFSLGLLSSSMNIFWERSWAKSLLPLWRKYPKLGEICWLLSAFLDGFLWKNSRYGLKSNRRILAKRAGFFGFSDLRLICLVMIRSRNPFLDLGCSPKYVFLLLLNGFPWTFVCKN